MPTLALCFATGAVGLGLIGCRAGDRASGARERGTARDGRATLLRVAIVPDSSTAAALADSLGHEGWEARMVPRPRATGEWIVSVVVPGDTTLASLVAHALARDSTPATIIGASPVRASLAVRVIRVNGGSHGMSARLRWALAPDRRAVLVVEDPRGVENDPVPNGFAFAAEGATWVQRDSVWDVAPSPDWRRLAYSRAYTTRPGETDTIPPAEWHRLAGRVGLLESLVRRNAFPTSGMVVAFGAARPFVIDVPAADTVPAHDVALPIAEGWRVAWTTDGSRLAIGAAPEITSDDAPAPRWRLVDPETGASRGVAEPSALARIQWIEGPTLDLPTTVDMTERRAFRAGEVDVESEGGWIRLYAREGGRLAAPRMIGPGVALTATANAEFVVAIAPDPAAKSYEPPNHLVVYRILRP